MNPCLPLLQGSLPIYCWKSKCFMPTAQWKFKGKNDTYKDTIILIFSEK